VPKWEVVKAVVGIAADQPEVKKQIEQINEARTAFDDRAANIAEAVGVEKDDLERAITTSTISGIREATKNWWGLRRGVRLWLPLTVALLIAGVLFFGITSALSQLNLAPALDAITTALAAIGGLLVVLAGSFAYPAGRVIALVRATRKATDNLVDDAKKQRRANLQSARTEAEKRAAAADLNAADARKKLDALREQLLATDPSRKMATFIKRRQASEDYRSRLGVVAKARDDFEQLTDLLAKQAKVEATPAAATAEDKAAAELFAPIDRIVLYIDDLDRCKESDVVAVLQAVHLLLAFKLFVVVVAVDPRWLLYSLRVTSHVLAGAQPTEKEEEDESGWEATPLNYLEKIFQIPYALRPMGKSGFEALVTDLVPKTVGSTNGSTRGAAGGAEPDLPAETNGTGPTGSPNQAGGRTGTGNEPTPALQTPPQSQGPTSSTPTGTPTETTQSADAQAKARQVRLVDLDPADLDITNAERSFMVELHSLIGTPRSAKRFVNVYRLFKASTPAAKRAELAEPALHRPILLLFAVLTGYPSEATTILRELMIGPKKSALWLSFVSALKEPTELTTLRTRRRPPNSSREYMAKEGLSAEKINEAERWATLQTKLARIDRVTGPMPAIAFAPWAPRVARYGFESSRVLISDDSAPRQEPAAEPVSA
jgi:hypothetical protein